jgi:hypothetical protein
MKNVLVANTIAFVVFASVFSWSAYRMETCGYDCGLVSVSSGTATVVYYVISFWLGMFSLLVCLVAGFLLFKKSKLKN